MDTILETLWSMKGYMIVGAVLLVAGSIVLWSGRKLDHPSRRTTKWIGFPLLGCGGCLLVYPLTLMAGGVLMVLGLVAVCERIAGC